MKILKPGWLLTSVMILGALIICTSPGSAQHRKAKAHKQAHIKHKKAHARHAAHHHYRHLPRRGAVVTALPNGIVVVKHKHGKLHYHNGVYYKPHGAAGFVVVRAPIGLRVKALPQGYKRVMVGAVAYHYYYGNFYKRVEDTGEFEVVDAPVGAEVDAIPDGYETETVDGVVYYTLEDVKYVEKQKGDEVVYRVIE